MTRVIDKIAALLYEGKRMSTKEISQECGTHIDHTREMVKRLHRARQIHICGWVQSVGGGSPAPIYMWGDAFDVDEPENFHEKEDKQPERQSYATIAKLRTSFIPNTFDPFRVLRAQVGAA
jgi:hypothetical protein